MEDAEGNQVPTIDDDFPEFDEAGLNKLTAEIDQMDAKVKHLCGWADVLHDTQAAISSYHTRMDCVEHALTRVTDQPELHFLRGSLYAAVVGSYERFVHEVFDLLVLHDDFFNLAKDALFKGLKEDDIRLSGLRKTDPLTREKLREVFHRSTLLDANKISCSVQKLFSLTFPTPANFSQISDTRHLFTHNAGIMSDGQPKPLLIKDIHILMKELDVLIAAYCNEIKAKAEAVTEG